MSKYVMITAKVSIATRPTRWTIASFLGAMRLPRRAYSMRTKTTRPPSSIGNGRMLRTARFMLMSAANSMSVFQPASSTTSPVS